MDYSSKRAILARDIGQKLGILRPAVRLYRKIFSKSYEDRFHNSLMAAIRPGDTCWDVGANIGHYVRLFSEKVGDGGKVVAFEPSPTSFEAITKIAKERANVIPHNIALSDTDGTATFYLHNTNNMGVTDSLSPSAEATRQVEVQVRRGDSYADFPPNIVKVDVEGFELEVLRGMTGVLALPGLRGVFVEVHFQEMKRRGLRDAPRDISELLAGAGFNIAWTDPSHISAMRG